MILGYHFFKQENNIYILDMMVFCWVYHVDIDEWIQWQQLGKHWVVGGSKPRRRSIFRKSWPLVTYVHIRNLKYDCVSSKPFMVGSWAVPKNLEVNFGTSFNNQHQGTGLTGLSWARCIRCQRNCPLQRSGLCTRPLLPLLDAVPNSSEL